MDNKTLAKTAASLYYRLSHQYIMLESVYSAANKKKIIPDILTEDNNVNKNNYRLYRVNTTII